MEAPEDLEKWWKKLKPADRIIVKAEVEVGETHVSRPTASLVFNKGKFLPGEGPIDWPPGVLEFVRQKIVEEG